MRRTAAVVLFAFAALVLAAVAAAADEEEAGGWVMSRFAAELTIGDNGDVVVDEEIVADFGDEERHGIFRVIPLRYPATEADLPPDAPADRGPEDYWRVIEIGGVSVDSPSAPDQVESSTEDGELVLRIGDPDQTISGEHRYLLSYTVRGALDDTSEGAVLEWNTTGQQWAVPIEQATATVTAPQLSSATCAAGPTGSTQECAQAQVEPDTAAFTAGPLAQGEGMTVQVRLPEGAVTVPPPQLTERWQLSRALTGNPLAWPLALVVAVAGVLALALLLRRGRDIPAEVAGTSAVRYDPPEGVLPAELGAVIDERVDQHELSGTLVHLADRGFLEIERRPDDGRKGDWTLRRRADGDESDLREWERALRDALFADDDEVALSDLRGKFAEAYGEFRSSIYREVVTRGWFPRSPATVRAQWLGAALAVLAVSIGILVAALLLTEIALAAIPLVLIALAFVALHWVMPHRTAEGSRLQAEARAYREGLQTQQQAGPWGDADPAAVFARHLPYAVVLGAVPQLVDRMGSLGVPAERWLPAWYYYPVGYAAWHDPTTLSSDLSSLADQVGGGLAHTPSGGGGAGGVSAGGGFGGGGGGGW